MEKQKLTLQQVLKLLDYGKRSEWKTLSDEEKSSISFWTLNRFMSSVSGDANKQANAVIKVNEIYNKHLGSIGVSKSNDHRELLWRLLCITGDTKKAEFHQWIGFKKSTKSSKEKYIDVIKDIYPTLKMEEVLLIVKLTDEHDLKRLAEEHSSGRKT
jgi:hypothetical protein